MAPNTFLASAFSKWLISADHNFLTKGKKKRRETSGAVRWTMGIPFTGVMKPLFSTKKWMEAVPAILRAVLKTPQKTEVLEDNGENWKDGGKPTNWVWVFLKCHSSLLLLSSCKHCRYILPLCTFLSNFWWKLCFCNKLFWRL